MAVERRKIHVGPREAVERNGSSLDRWVEGADWLEGPAEAVQGALLAAYGALGEAGTSLKSMLHGTRPLGHPLHPAVVSVPLGAFTVMVLADWMAMPGWVPA